MSLVSKYINDDDEARSVAVAYYIIYSQFYD